MIPLVFENRTSLITDPRDGRIPPLTPEAQARRPRPGPQVQTEWARGSEYA